jgi:hypothetical protein
MSDAARSEKFLLSVSGLGMLLTIVLLSAASLCYGLSVNAASNGDLAGKAGLDMAGMVLGIVGAVIAGPSIFATTCKPVAEEAVSST